MHFTSEVSHDGSVLLEEPGLKDGNIGPTVDVSDEIKGGRDRWRRSLPLSSETSSPKLVMNVIFPASTGDLERDRDGDFDLS